MPSSNESAWLDSFQERVMAMLQLGNASIFGFFGKARWLRFFNTSLLHTVLLPLLGLVFIVDAAINWVRFGYARNQNLDSLLKAVVASLGAVGACISIIGGLLAEYVLHTSFAAGPWFFLAAVSISALHTLALLVVNGVRALLAPKASTARASLLQSSVRHAFNVILLAAVMSSVIFGIISPGAPIITMVAAFTAVTCSLLNLVWQFMPDSFQSAVKRFLGLAKPSETAVPGRAFRQVNEVDLGSIAVDNPISQQIVASHQGSFFKPAYRLDAVKQLTEQFDPETARSYLCQEIERKLAVLRSVKDDASPTIIDDYIERRAQPAQGLTKSQQKIAILVAAKRLLDGEVGSYQSISAMQADSRFRLHAQSFFAQKSDTTDILAAVKYFLTAHPLTLDIHPNYGLSDRNAVT